MTQPRVDFHTHSSTLPPHVLIHLPHGLPPCILPLHPPAPPFVLRGCHLLLASVSEVPPGRTGRPESLCPMETLASPGRGQPGQAQAEDAEDGSNPSLASSEHTAGSPGSPLLSANRLKRRTRSWQPSVAGRQRTQSRLQDSK